MPLTLSQRFALFMHKVPSAPIERALRVVEAETLPVTFDQLEAHHLSRGDPEWVVAIMVSENRRTAEDWVKLTAADLALVLLRPDA
jgi:hypothetical protein